MCAVLEVISTFARGLENGAQGLEEALEAGCPPRRVGWGERSTAAASGVGDPLASVPQRG